MPKTEKPFWVEPVRTPPTPAPIEAKPVAEEIEYRPSAGPAVAPGRVEKSAAVRSLVAAHEEDRQLRERHEIERRSVEAKKAAAAELQGEFDSMCQARCDLRKQILKGEAEFATASDRMKVLQDEAFQAWKLGRGLGDHQIEYARRWFECDCLEPWLKSWRSDLATLEVTIKTFSECHGCSEK